MDAIPPRATRSPRRREVLAVGAAAKGALLLGGLTAGRARAAGSPATVAATGSDPYDDLRGTWSDILTGGGAVNPSDPDYAHAIATADATADAAIALYDDSATPLGVYRDLPLTHDPGMRVDFSTGTPRITLDLTQGLPGTSRTAHLLRVSG